MVEDDFSILYQDLPETDITGTGMEPDGYDPTIYGPPQDRKEFKGAPIAMMILFIVAGVVGLGFLIFAPVFLVLAFARGLRSVGNLLSVLASAILLIPLLIFGISGLINKKKLVIGPDGIELYKRKKRVLRAPWQGVVKVFTLPAQGNQMDVLGLLTRDGYDIRIPSTQIKRDTLKEAYQFMLPFCNHYLVTLDNQAGW